MAELSSATFTILNWFLYVGIALAAGAVIASLVFFAFGNTATAKRLFVSGLIGLLIGSSVAGIFNALVEGVNVSEPANLILYAVVACLIVCAVIFFGLSRREEGVNYAIAAVLAAGFIALIPAVQALFGSETITLAGTCMLDASVSPPSVKVGETLTLEVSMPYGTGSYSLTVDFGDGNKASGSITAGRTATFRHAYDNPGTYVIMIEASGKGLCYYALGLNVGDPPSPWFLGPFDLGGLWSSISATIKFPMHLFYWTPEFNLDKNSEDMRLYAAVTSVAITALGLFLAIRIVSGFLERDPSTSLVDSIKEAVLVLAVILLAPYLYQAFAYLCNQVSSLVVDRVAVWPSLITLVSIVTASFFLGVVSSFAGTFGGTLLVAFMLSTFTAAIRYVLIKGIVYCVPLLAVAYLFPAARGAVRFFMSVLAGLVLAGPIAAFVLAGFTNLGGAAGFIGTAFAPAITFMGFPILLSMASGASPVGAAQGFAKLFSGAVAGFRGYAPALPSDSGKGIVSSGGSGGSGEGGAGMSMRIFEPKKPEDYIKRWSQGSSQTPVRSPSNVVAVSAAAPSTDSHVSASPNVIVAPPAETSPPPSSGFSTPDPGPAAAGSATPPPEQEGAQQRQERQLKEAFKGLVTQRLRPWWARTVTRYGPWLSYGHSVVLGGRHPFREIGREKAANAAFGGDGRGENREDSGQTGGQTGDKKDDNKKDGGTIDVKTLLNEIDWYMYH